MESARRSLHWGLYSIARRRRWETIRRHLDPNAGSLLDIGCLDLFTYEELKDKYACQLADLEPRHEMIRREDLQHLTFDDKSFDIVLCQQMLEHVPDPVQAMRELKRVTRRQLIVTVPNEPWFTLCRLLRWDKDHLWAVTRMALACHLGKPAHEGTCFFGRYYFGVWRFE